MRFPPGATIDRGARAWSNAVSFCANRGAGHQMFYHRLPACATIKVAIILSTSSARKRLPVEVPMRALVIVMLLASPHAVCAASVIIEAEYPGASPEMIIECVAVPLEAQLKGIE